MHKYINNGGQLSLVCATHLFQSVGATQPHPRTKYWGVSPFTLKTDLCCYTNITPPANGQAWKRQQTQQAQQNFSTINM